MVKIEEELKQIAAYRSLFDSGYPHSALWAPFVADHWQACVDEIVQLRLNEVDLLAEIDALHFDLGLVNSVD